MEARSAEINELHAANARIAKLAFAQAGRPTKKDAGMHGAPLELRGKLVVFSGARAARRSTSPAREKQGSQGPSPR